jgi:hypothetical protein
MNAEKLLNNTSAQLNAYQLACGYLQIKRFMRQKLSVTLWHESAHYHVRLAYYAHPTMVGFIEWHGGLDTLSEARKVFRNECSIAAAFPAV